VRDDTLVQKLYHTLNNILGETLLAADAESYLLASFSTKFQLDELGSKDKDWAVNPNEAHVSFFPRISSGDLADPWGAESVVAKQRILRRHSQVFVGI